VDGLGRTEINDFRGRSKSELVDRYVEIEVVDAPPRGRENEPNVLGVLASLITHGDQDNFRDPARYGFAQIWLVGPMTDRCWKIA
jgi:hypothetical protein